MANTVFQQSKGETTKYVEMMSNPSLLKPYFELTPLVVVSRLTGCFLPWKSPAWKEARPIDLYVPLMVAFSMVLVYVIQLSKAGFSPVEGTLLGTALVTIFVYWFLLAAVLFSVSFATFADRLSALDAISIAGYSLSSLLPGMIAHAIFAGFALYYFIFFCGLAASSLAFFVAAQFSSVLPVRFIAASFFFLAQYAFFYYLLFL